jgi:hypothetical protein
MTGLAEVIAAYPAELVQTVRSPHRRGEHEARPGQAGREVQPSSNRAAHPGATLPSSNRGIGVTRSVAGHQVTLDAQWRITQSFRTIGKVRQSADKQVRISATLSDAIDGGQ